MRGALDPAQHWPCLVWIIPADAGSTQQQVGAGHHEQDHPRGCGEHLRHARTIAVVNGSSPRMRGAQIIPTFSMIELRIIPADAGSTIGSCSGR